MKLTFIEISRLIGIKLMKILLLGEIRELIKCIPESITKIIHIKIMIINNLAIIFEDLESIDLFLD